MVEGQVRDGQWAVLDCVSVSVSTNSFHPRLLALIIWFPFIISTGLHHAGPSTQQLLLLISCHFCKEPLLLQSHFRETFWLNYKWINTEDCTGMQFAISERRITWAVNGGNGNEWKPLNCTLFSVISIIVIIDVRSRAPILGTGSVTFWESRENKLKNSQKGKVRPWWGW